MKVYSNIEATVVIADLRNFTHLYEEFQNKDISILLNFMEEYYSLGLEIADLASYDFNYYVNSTGDGLLITFFGIEHEKCGYIFCLLLYQLMNNYCEKLNKENNCWTSFGIGIETGIVQKIVSNNTGRKLETFLGSVINIAARLEEATKMYGRTKLIMGNTIYKILIEKTNKKEFDRLINNNPDIALNYAEEIDYHNEINVLNQKLMLFYIFEHNLKGVESPIPLYRLSPTLADINKGLFFEVLEQLSDTPERFNAFKNYLKEKLKN